MPDTAAHAPSASHTRWSSGAWAPWALRISWIVTGWTGWRAIEIAVEDRSRAVEVTAMAGGAAIWLLGVASMALATTVTLTALRVIVPLSMPVAALAIVFGADAPTGVGVLVGASISTLLAMTAEVGQVFVQAEAYGDELRFPLRPPLAQLIGAVIAWVIWAGTAISGFLLTAAGGWIPGVVLIVSAVAMTVLAITRWHRLSRRWMVFVPAGLVLHDPVVLAETLMLPTSNIVRMRLAPADTEALDLTGPASGHAVEVTTHELVTAVIAPTTRGATPKAVHLSAYLASPSRPGRALTAATARDLPVG